MKPLLFLDVDGVLNLARVERTTLPPDLYLKHLVYQMESGRWGQRSVLLDRGHKPLLAVLAEHFELVWGTAWEHWANELLAEALGLPQLPVVRFVERFPQPHLHWKTAILAAYAKDRPFCWIDDEADRRDQTYFNRQGLTACVLSTDPVYGLTGSIVQAALAFAASLDPAQDACLSA